MSSDALRLDELADEFEALWKGGSRPSIADFLARVPDNNRHRLLELLVPLDIEYRIAAGEAVEPGEYLPFGPAAVLLATRTIADPSIAQGGDAAMVVPEQPEGTGPVGVTWVASTTGPGEGTGGQNDPTFDFGPSAARDPGDSSRNIDATQRLIDRYRLLRRLGKGGMGEVWEAEQTEPVRRLVALKLIRASRVGREYLARFAAEQQALALMNHPNIARILDAGTTDEGQPYFVMELVPGLPLTRFCDEHQLGIPERLDLFLQVCAGIQHAHQKGIIHRDLKPGNILVTELDGKPVPRIIDFGLAKALDAAGRLSDRSIETEVGQVLGTLRYMAPEQADLDNIDIDTRADIYALGAILYELMTGSTPLEDSDLGRMARLKVLELIREKTPPRPSQRLARDSGENQSTITSARRTDSSRLRRILAGDLDWIVMKALEKDRARRYESASGMAADIRRYLQGDRVLATPPSRLYLFRKFVSKNRGAVAASMLLLLSLAGGLVGTALGLLEARKQAAFARDETARKELERLRAQQARDEAEEERQRALVAQEIARIAEQHALLAQGQAKESELVAQRRLKQVTDAFDLLNGVFSDLDIQQVRESGEPVEAILAKRLVSAGKQIVESRDEVSDFDTFARLVNQLASTISSLGFAPEAAELMERTLAGMPDSTEMGTGIWPELICSLAGMYEISRKLDLAVQRYQQVLELTEQADAADSMIHFRAMAGLGNCRRLQKAPAEAIRLLERASDGLARVEGETSPIALFAMNNLALARADAGQFPEAIAMLRTQVALKQELFGPSHPETLVALQNLGANLRKAGQLDEALGIFRDVWQARRRVLGADHPNTANSLNSIAAVLAAQGKDEEAAPLYEEVLRIRLDRLPEGHPFTSTVMSDLAVLYWRLERLDKSVPLFEQLVALLTKTRGPEDPETWKGKFNLAVNLRDAGRLEEALALFEQAWDRDQGDQSVLSLAPELRDACLKAGRVDRFREVATEELAAARRVFGADSPSLMIGLDSLGKDYLRAGMPGEAAELLRESLTLSQELLPDRWTNFRTQALLGSALLALAIAAGDADEKARLLAGAEPLLVSGFEGMKARASAIPRRSARCLPDALGRLVELYTLLEKPEEAQKYRELQSTFESP